MYARKKLIPKQNLVYISKNLSLKIKALNYLMYVNEAPRDLQWDIRSKATKALFKDHEIGRCHITVLKMGCPIYSKRQHYKCIVEFFVAEIC